VISTYSIVACDLHEREWGVGVQSKFLAVGAAVPAAAPEVGAIATQACANLAYRPQGLALLQEGYAAEDVVRALVGADEISCNRLNRPLRRRQPDALQRSFRKRFQAFERERQVRAPSRSDDRMDLVDDDRSNRSEQAAAPFGGEQQEE